MTLYYRWVEVVFNETNCRFVKYLKKRCHFISYRINITFCEYKTAERSGKTLFHVSMTNITQMAPMPIENVGLIGALPHVNYDWTVLIGSGA